MLTQNAIDRLNYKFHSINPYTKNNEDWENYKTLMEKLLTRLLQQKKTKCTKMLQ